MNDGFQKGLAAPPLSFEPKSYISLQTASEKDNRLLADITRPSGRQLGSVQHSPGASVELILEPSVVNMLCPDIGPAAMGVVRSLLVC